MRDERRRARRSLSRIHVSGQGATSDGGENDGVDE